MRPGRARTLTGIALIFAALLGWSAFATHVVHGQSVDDGRSGRLVAVFPPGTSRQATLDKLARTDARLVKDSFLPFVWTLYSAQPDLAGRLRQSGAIGVFPDTGLFRCLSLEL